MQTIKQKLASRKFWAALLGAMAPVILAYMGQEIPVIEAAKLSAGIIVSYILGQGYVDGQAAKALN